MRAINPVLFNFENNRQMSYIDELKSRGQQAAGEVKSNPLNALKTVLNEMPVRTKKLGDKPPEDQVKQALDVAASNVLSTLVAIEGPKLAGAIGGLSDSERDTLMKFIYRGFDEMETNADGKKVCKYDCQILLKAHEEICKKSGTGPVIRSIHTRLEV